MKNLITLGLLSRQDITIKQAYAQLMQSIDGGLFLGLLVVGFSEAGGWFAMPASSIDKRWLISTYKQTQFTKTLRELGIVKTKKRKVDGTPMLHYWVSMEKLNETLADLDFQKFEIQKFENPYIYTNTLNNRSKKEETNTSSLRSEVLVADGSTEPSGNENDEEKTNSQGRRESDLDRIKKELFGFFVNSSGLTEVTLPKEGSARNKLCYDLLLKLYLYYREPYTDHDGAKTKTKYNYDPVAIEKSKHVLGEAIKRQIADKLTIKSVESIRAKMGDVMREAKRPPQPSGKASLLT